MVNFIPHRRLGLGLVGLALLLLVGCAEADSHAPSHENGEPGQTSNTDPSLTVDTKASHLQVVDLEGIKTIIAESSDDDRVLVIDFWATWCVPCVEMFPELHKGLVDLGDRVRAVTVTLDDPSREAAAIAFLSEQHALTDAYIFKSDSAAQQALVDGLGDRWNNLAVPAILVYDPGKGLVGEFLEGGTTPQIIALVNTLLASDQEEQP